MAFPNLTEQQAMSEINVTPLVDVMLVLLVVFIVTAPLLTQSVRVNLPKTAPTSPTLQKHIVSLSIDAQGLVFLDKRLLPIEALELELKALLQHDSEVSVRLHADERVPYGRVAKVMAAAQRAGINKLAFVTVEE
jgi:Biopolymer transport protein